MSQFSFIVYNYILSCCCPKAARSIILHIFPVPIPIQRTHRPHCCPSGASLSPSPHILLNKGKKKVNKRKQRKSAFSGRTWSALFALHFPALLLLRPQRCLFQPTLPLLIHPSQDNYPPRLCVHKTSTAGVSCASAASQAGREDPVGQLPVVRQWRAVAAPPPFLPGQTLGPGEQAWPTLRRTFVCPLYIWPAESGG